MTRTLLFLAAALSLVPAAGFGPLAEALPPGARLALAGLPWVALVGLPPSSRAGGAVEPIPRTWPADLALALPLLALAAWIDLREGAPVAALGITAAEALGAAALLGEARHRAGSRAGWIYGLGWAVLLPAGPALDAALGGRFEPVHLVAGLSPLAWAWERAGSGLATGLQPAFGPLAAAGVLCFLAAVSGGRPAGERA